MENFKALTGGRACAAFLVFFHHHRIQSGFNLIDRFQLEMHVGVSIFFVLSGFLITYRYFENYRLDFPWIKKYLINRFSRIYPIYFVLVVLTLYMNEYSIKVWILNLTLFKGFFDNTKFIGIPQSWTLTVEACFYLSAPLIFMLFKKYKNIYIVGIILSLSSLIGMALYSFAEGSAFLAKHQFYFIYTFGGRFVEFFMGMVAALFVIKGYKVSSFKIPLKQIVGITGVILSVYCLTRLQNNSYDIGLHHPLGQVINNIILPLFFSYTLLGLIQENTVLTRFLSSKIMQILGASSYVFYLIHVGVIYSLLVVLGITNNFLLFFILNVISVLLYRFIEKPANLFIRARTNL